MDKLIELLQQIQDLAGVAIDALKGAGGGGEGGGKPPEGGGAPPEGAAPAEGGAGGAPPEGGAPKPPEER